LKVLQADNGKEFVNNQMTRWMDENSIVAQYCEKDDKKCLGVGERFNRTIKLSLKSISPARIPIDGLTILMISYRITTRHIIPTSERIEKQKKKKFKKHDKLFN
jgi:hypothetical protein